MSIPRRDFVGLGAAEAVAASLPGSARSAAGAYNFGRFRDASLLHMTDTRMTLMPVYFREPTVNLGLGAVAGKPPHLAGRAFLGRFAISRDSADAYAFTCLDFEKSAARCGRLGGFAHLKTLVDRLRGEVGPGHS